MLLDHVRETFYLHHQLTDPMVVSETSPALFFSRMVAHLCAPVFVFLAGLSAYLYGSRQADGRAAASTFLWKRGLFLVFLEFTVVNFAWTFQFPPTKIYLQVIWAIGVCMLALAGLVWLPRQAILATGVILVAGHNFLDGIHLPADHVLHVAWAILHDRGWIHTFNGALRLRTSYPVLPWIGVIALGYAIGPWFAQGSAPSSRSRRLLACGWTLLGGFVVLRALDIYGDRSWSAGESFFLTFMSFVNVTKYPPSLLFVALTLGIGMLLLREFEGRDGAAWLAPLVIFGSAPMFFYVLHLYVLKLLYQGAVAIWGPNHGELFGLDRVWQLWATAALMATLLYPAVKAFSKFKSRRRDIAWLRYL